jgi:very-short-patch-repair endonuclease
VSFEIDARIAVLAARQQGNVTREQLLRSGLSPKAIRYRIRAARLFPVFAGVLAVGRPATTALEFISAAVLSCGPAAVASHASAAFVLGWRKACRRPYDVTAPVRRQRANLVVHRSDRLLPRDRRRLLSVLITSPARTLLDLAPTLDDRALRRALDDARLSGQLRLPALGDVLERFPRHPGARRLRELLAEDPGPTRSEFEEAFLVFTQQHGLPRPQMNVRVAGYEVDALFVEEGVVVELDGFAYHRSRASFERDRDKDADLAAHDLVAVRVTWQRMRRRAGREAQRLHRILERRRGYWLPHGTRVTRPETRVATSYGLPKRL